MTELEAFNQMNYDLDRYTLYVETLRANSSKSQMVELSKKRSISVETLEKAGIFWVGDAEETMLDEFKDDLKNFGVVSEINRPIFHHRWLFPIKNAKGQVINLVGYTYYDDMRYLYAKGKYYDRSNTLYGLENINLAYDLGYAIITEGITDTIALRELGFLNTFAWCGTMESQVKINLLNRCKYGVIRIPDRDAPGEKTKQRWLFNRYLTLVTMHGAKDTAELLSVNEEVRQYYKACLEESIKWILKKEHKGTSCATTTLNM